jgi:O-antigen ligase
MSIPWKKLEECLFYFFLFALPLQVRTILIERDWIFSEWRSASLYATDILFVALILFWLVRLLRMPKDAHFSFDGVDKALIVFLAAATASLRYPFITAISEFQLLKLFQFGALFAYVKYYAVRRFELKLSLIALVAGGVFQSLISIGQFIKQGDLGLQWMGESVLIPEMQGVAVFFNAAGEKIMRVYGTVPHPNILAGYLLVNIFALYYLFVGSEKTFPSYKLLVTISYGLLLFAFLLAFSRTTTFVWALAFAVIVIALWRRHFERRKLIQLVVATAVLCALFAGLFWPEIVARLTISSQEEAVTLRLYYNKAALRSGFTSAWKSYTPDFLEPVLGPVLNLNWTGVGIGNFVTWFMWNSPNLPRHYYQPAHNIYLLIYSETGILGAGTFLVFLVLLLKRYFAARFADHVAKLCLGLVLGALLFIGFFDHFPWTLQQGRLLLWGVLGFVGALARKA